MNSLTVLLLIHFFLVPLVWGQDETIIEMTLEGVAVVDKSLGDRFWELRKEIAFYNYQLKSQIDQQLVQREQILKLKTELEELIQKIEQNKRFIKINEQLSGTENLAINVLPETEITISNPYGGIEINYADGNKMNLTATKKAWGDNPEQVKKNFDGLKLKAKQNGKKVTIQFVKEEVGSINLVYQGKEQLVNFPAGSVQLKIDLPTVKYVKLNCIQEIARDKIIINKLRANLEITWSKFPIFIRNVEGNVKILSNYCFGGGNYFGGKVVARQAAVAYDTTIAVSQVNGNITIKTDLGNVYLDHIKQNISIENIAGLTVADVSQIGPQHKTEFTSESGLISVTVAKASPPSLYIKTVYGTITYPDEQIYQKGKFTHGCRWNSEMLEERFLGQDYRTHGYRLKIETKSGDIKIDAP